MAQPRPKIREPQLRPSTAKLKPTNQQMKPLTNTGVISLNRSDSLLPTMVNTKLTEDILPAQRTFTSFKSMREIQEKKNELNIQAADGTDNKCYGN